jgi:glycosyltransferase involved in cell wall biosynthesis
MQKEISVIIPTCGRPESIRLTIQSLLSINTCPERFEILVIDNNFEDNLSNNLKEYCSSLNEKVRYVREISPGLTAARHKGVYEANGVWLTFIDDDVIVSEGWLDAILMVTKDPAVGMIGGPSLPWFSSTIPSWFWGFIEDAPFGGWMCTWLSLLDLGVERVKIEPEYIFGLNFTIRKDLLLGCGGFHPDLVPASLQRWQGDGETGLTRKFRKSGFIAIYTQGALLHHICGAERLNIHYFQKRAFYQGVCDSYSQIRAGCSGLDKEIPYFNFGSIRNKFAKFLMSFKGCNTDLDEMQKSHQNVFKLSEDSYLKGWQFHQAEVKSDPDLLNWIKRPDYLNADIAFEMQSKK